MLYSHKGNHPSVLPFRITLSNGQTRTDPSTFTAEEIADAGYVAAPEPPSPLYYQFVTWDGADWVVHDRPLEELKAGKLMAFIDIFGSISSRPVLDTGLGFSVQAGHTDLISFEVGVELGITTVRAADNTSHSVTLEQLQQIISMIKQNGLVSLQSKWAIEDAIKTAQTREELEAISFYPFIQE